MKPKNIIITILAIVIIAQFIQSFFILSKLNQLRIGLVEKPAEVYIADLTQRLHDVQIARGKVIWQADWLSRQLGKCIEELENREGLKPIPMKSPYPLIEGLPSPDPNERMRRLQAEPFFKPYEEPNSPQLEDMEERPVRYALCSLNLELFSLRMAKENFDRVIENYEQRLKRF
jgi:hypothetical protein